MVDGSKARFTWRLHKARILIELAGRGVAVVDNHIYELHMEISEGVPLCRIVCGDEIMVQGALL